MQNNLKYLLATGLFLCALGFNACTDDPSKKDHDGHKYPPPFVKVEHPAFNVDSAFAWVEKQVSFGYRIPNSPAHVACGDYLVNTFRRFTPHVIEQKAGLKAHDGVVLQSRNIIASFNPESKVRVLLSAHWDTRPHADQDEKNPSAPVPGANDGASGVGVLLECARILQLKPPTVGVDIILWDSEDYGVPEEDNSFCLGSQYWAKNKHVAGYSAKFGINLDMVGAEGATFMQDGTSLQFAPDWVNYVWGTAGNLGYSQYFLYNQTQPIIDDHLYVSRDGGVPMVDIIHQNIMDNGFFEHWHTTGDVPSVISKNTLSAVGNTVLQVVYQQK